MMMSEELWLSTLPVLRRCSTGVAVVFDWSLIGLLIDQVGIEVSPEMWPALEKKGCSDERETDFNFGNMFFWI